MIGALGAAYALWRAWKDRRSPPRLSAILVLEDRPASELELRGMREAMEAAWANPANRALSSLGVAPIRWEFRE